MSLNEWNERPDPQTRLYHENQYDEPYRSTVAFAEFVAEKLDAAKFVVDAGCGAGAPTHYLAENHPQVDFLGIDSSQELLQGAKTRENLRYERDSFSNLQVRFGVDGVTLIQVLSWLPWYDETFHQIATRIRPKWIAFSTLMYAGDIDCQIVVNEHKRPRRSFYNIYGLPGLERFMKGEGYKLCKCAPFMIDIDLPAPSGADSMGSYTVGRGKVWPDIHSGPLSLPWFFVMFERG